MIVMTECSDQLSNITDVSDFCDEAKVIDPRLIGVFGVISLISLTFYFQVISLQEKARRIELFPQERVPVNVAEKRMLLDLLDSNTVPRPFF